MEMTVERTMEIGDIRLGKYYPATFDSPAEGGEIEDYTAEWVDYVTKWKDGKNVREPVYTELTELEYDIFEAEIEEWIYDHYDYEDDGPDPDDRDR